MSAAYLGPPGTFSHEALLAADAHERGVPVATVHDAIAAVRSGDVARALVPLENSLEGAVGATLDALVDAAGEVVITGEVVHPVHHCLIAAEPVELGAIRTVLSHPQASGQCADFVRTRLAGATVVPASSTAEAVRLVAEHAAGTEPAAALGTRTAAGLYGCVVLEEGVEDSPDNVTRFVWVMRDMAAPDLREGPHKTSVVWWGGGDESPGWLVRCLSEFAFRGVNLTRIESRPRRLGLGHYLFFADLDGADTKAPVAEAIEALRTQAEEVRVLGSYPAA
jgi:prephenate dehydratase